MLTEKHASEKFAATAADESEYDFLEWISDDFYSRCISHHKAR